MTSVASGNVVDTAEKAMQSMGMGSKHAEEVKKCVTCNAKDDPSGAKMTAVTFEGTKNMTVIEHHKPAVTDEADAIIRMTSSGLCGTDLHIYLGHVPGMRNGRIIGHEVIGIVDSVGPKVTDIKKGDRVAVSTQISCGDCHFCKKEQFSECDNTNASVAQEKMLGGRTAGIPGFNELSGGFNGGQAEFVRVPFADVNCLKLPPESEISDAKVLPLTDILCTAWLGNELGKVKENDVVAIWGAGPVGQLAAQCAFVRGARRVILVDKLAYRLEFAKKTMPKIETVDFSKGPSSNYAGENQVLEMCKNEPAHAPDVCIECVGMHYAHSFMHKVEMALGLETDTPEALNAAIHACKKGGRVVGIGVYVGLANHFNVGAILMKSLSLKMGTVPPQKYWHQLLEMIKEGKIDPSVIMTHTMALEDAPKAYQIFDEKLDDVIKIVFKPPKQPGNP